MAERSARAEATVEELYRIDGKAELVDGAILHMLPTGHFPGFAASEAVPGWSLAVNELFAEGSA